jgi:hypothetical protein
VRIGEFWVNSFSEPVEVAEIPEKEHPLLQTLHILGAVECGRFWSLPRKNSVLSKANISDSYSVQINNLTVVENTGLVHTIYSLAPQVH